MTGDDGEGTSGMTAEEQRAEAVRVVAIIPARGGSKGVPRKNLRRVGGVPLIERAVRTASETDGIDLVVVSTDDDEIAAVSEAAGARVVRRPAEISGDTASSESAILHALDVLEADGEPADVVAFLQATSPFIAPDALSDAVREVHERRADSVFAAHETYGFLWSRGGAGPASAAGRTSDASRTSRADQARRARQADAGTAVAINHDAAHRPRRQDREPHFLETGAFYVFRADGFREARHRFFGRIRIAEVPEWTAIEIDDEQQLRIARALAALHESPERVPVRAIVTDFDGVHTDDTATVDADGVERVRVSREDGMGVSLLRRAGIPMLILSTEVNAVVRARADKLRVPVLHGIDDKESALRRWAEEMDIPLADIAYLGNDVNDLPALRIVGWPVAVADAHPLVREAARVVLRRSGGHGAVRELIERVLPA